MALFLFDPNPNRKFILLDASDGLTANSKPVILVLPAFAERPPVLCKPDSLVRSCEGQITRGVAVNEEQILQLLELTAKEYRELAESLVPPLRNITINNRRSSEVAAEVAAALDKLIAKIRDASTTF
jgi:hypothetical protein